MAPVTTVYDFTPTAPDGSASPMAAYRGKVLLIVNVASKCGFTPQYAGLEALRRRYAPKGFELLGFPCNQFGAQEPGGPAEIAAFCSTSYDVTFPILAKIDVNGPKADPVYAFLKHEKPGLFGSEAIKWNFTKFLLDRHGKVAARFSPTTKPEALQAAIETLLVQ